MNEKNIKILSAPGDNQLQATEGRNAPLVLVSSSMELLSYVVIVVRCGNLLDGLIVSVDHTLSGKYLCKDSREKS